MWKACHRNRVMSQDLHMMLHICQTCLLCLPMHYSDMGPTCAVARALATVVTMGTLRPRARRRRFLPLVSLLMHYSDMGPT